MSTSSYNHLVRHDIQQSTKRYDGQEIDGEHSYRTLIRVFDSKARRDSRPEDGEKPDRWGFFVFSPEPIELHSTASMVRRREEKRVENLQRVALCSSYRERSGRDLRSLPKNCQYFRLNVKSESKRFQNTTY